MTKLFLGAAVFCAMACSSAALADEPSQHQVMLQTAQIQSSTNEPTTDLGKQVVCTSSYHDGDVIKRPTCLTRDQRQFNRLQEQQHLRDIQTRSLTVNSW
jgi:hypothetical protein